jgi:hypothetical protein
MLRADVNVCPAYFPYFVSGSTSSCDCGDWLDIFLYLEIRCFFTMLYVKSKTADQDHQSKVGLHKINIIRTDIEVHY